MPGTTEPLPGSNQPNPRRVVAIVATVALVVGGMMWFDQAVTPGVGGLVHLPLSAQPAEARFALAASTEIQVWADVDMRHVGISPKASHTALPRVVEMVIELRSDAGERTSLRCNPLDSHIARTSGEHNSMGEDSGRYYDGLVNGCAVRLPAGQWTVRAWLEPVEPADRRVRFDRLGLILRAR
ncbi:MAG: hypothetical protein R3F39_11820 [Myxococcota bacterium]